MALLQKLHHEIRLMVLAVWVLSLFCICLIAIAPLATWALWTNQFIMTAISIVACLFVVYGFRQWLSHPIVTVGLIPILMTLVLLDQQMGQIAVSPPMTATASFVTTLTLDLLVAYPFVAACWAIHRRAGWRVTAFGALLLTWFPILISMLSSPNYVVRSILPIDLRASWLPVILALLGCLIPVGFMAEATRIFCGIRREIKVTPNSRLESQVKQPIS